MKDDNIEEPTLYLGTDIGKFYFEGDSKPRWSLSSTKYTAKAVAAVEQELGTEKYGYKYLPKSASSPLSHDYRPEIDISEELNPELQNYY